MKHVDSFEKYKKEVNDPKNKQQRKRKSEDVSVPPKRNSNSQQLSKFGFTTSPIYKTKKQQQFDDNLVDFIVSGMKPFSTVDDKAFKQLFSFDPTIHVMSRRVLMEKIDARTARDHAETIAELSRAKYVSTMTDIWSTKHHSYLGISAHWLGDDLQRRSRVMSCPHFRNPHTGERIASTLQAAHDENGLTGNKLVSTTTDSASTMIHAFAFYGVTVADVEYITDDESDEEQELDEIDVDAGPGSVTVTDEELSSLLPPHQR